MKLYENGRLTLPNGTMDYVRFGTGSRIMLMLPGLSDGLKTLKGMALPFYLLYRKLTRAFTVYSFSARSPLSRPCSTEELAEDLYAAIRRLGIQSACVLGVSMGGMVAQQLALRHPDAVERLILCVTLSRPNETERAALTGWMEMAKRGDYRAILQDTARKSYTEAYFNKNRLSYTLLGDVGKPKSFERFLTMAEACLSHDCHDQLSRIACPTLVIGGGQDRIVGGDAAGELAAAIPNAQLMLYPDYSHGLYEEAPDFLDQVLRFLN